MEDEENLSKSSQKDFEVYPGEKKGGGRMIAKMTKVTFLVYHKEYDCFLKNIREPGSGTCSYKSTGRC